MVKRLLGARSRVGGQYRGLGDAPHKNKLLHLTQSSESHRQVQQGDWGWH